MRMLFNYLANVLDDHTAVGFRTGGMGGDVVHLLQSGVDHMALVGVHGLQGGAAVDYAAKFLFT